MSVVTVGIDVANHVCQIHGVDTRGQVAVKTRLTRAEAMCEAVSRLTLRVVTPTSIAQQALQRRHRIRPRLIQTRTALTNPIRGLLGDYGLTRPRPMRQVRRR